MKQSMKLSLLFNSFMSWSPASVYTSCHNISVTMETSIVVANSMAAVRHGRYRPIAAFPAKRPNHLAARDVSRCQLNAPDKCHCLVWPTLHLCAVGFVFIATRLQSQYCVLGRLLWEWWRLTRLNPLFRQISHLFVSYLCSSSNTPPPSVSSGGT